MLIDSHCHLHAAAYPDAREAVRVALTYNVWGIVAVGCDPATNDKTLRAARAMPKAIWACLGFHPDWNQLTDHDLDRVEAQVREHRGHVVALGEIGLPWYSLEGDADATTRMAKGRTHLNRLLGIAADWDLPVVLHAPHAAAADALEALKRHRIEHAVFHWHKAPEGVTRAIVEAGYFVSVTPEVVYRERDRLMVDAVPLDSLVVESDGPWAYQGEFEGLPSGPWLVSRVAEEIAKLKRLPVDDVMFRLSENTCQLFGLPWV
jgi:TatD DNase family protein